MARAYLKLLVPTQVIVCFLSHNGEGDIDLYDCQYETFEKFLAVDHSAHTSMKDAAKCER
mgnify:CR=1 FL=1